jgi:hypothetical protein
MSNIANLNRHRMKFLCAGLLSLAFPLDAFAHGEQVILVAIALIASISGAVSGLLSGTIRKLEKINCPQWFLIYLCLGCLILGIKSSSFDGIALFLAFGGIGGVIPFILFYFVAKYCSGWLISRFGKTRSRF